MQYPHPRGLVS